MRPRLIRSSSLSRARSSVGPHRSARCCSRVASLSWNLSAVADSTASRPVTRPSTTNGTVSTDGAAPAAARTAASDGALTAGWPSSPARLACSTILARLACARLVRLARPTRPIRCLRPACGSGPPARPGLLPA